MVFIVSLNWQMMDSVVQNISRDSRFVLSSSYRLPKDAMATCTWAWYEGVWNACMRWRHYYAIYDYLGMGRTRSGGVWGPLYDTWLHWRVFSESSSVKYAVSVHTRYPRWIISEREIKAWIPDMLFQALSTLPQLRDVALDDEGRGLQLFPRYSMHELSNLRRISVRGSYNSSIPNPVQGLSSVIRNSPNLEEVLINMMDNNPKEYAFERPRLHIRHLFEPQSSQEPLRNIRNLVLSGVDMGISESDSIDVLPHILGLETLNITEEYPVSQNFWVTLRSAQVQLRKIKFCGLPNREMIEYLDSESFSGLEELDVTYRGGRFGSADDMNGTTDFESSSDCGDMLVVLGSSNDRLYGRVLNRHADTLRSLRLCISPTWDYDASLWEWDLDTLAKCQSLEELAFDIEDNHIQEDLVVRIIIEQNRCSTDVFYTAKNSIDRSSFTHQPSKAGVCGG